MPYAMEPRPRISLLVTSEPTRAAVLVLEDLRTGARASFDTSTALLAALEARLLANAPRAAADGVRPSADGINPA